jgi:hypothetical protein
LANTFSSPVGGKFLSSPESLPGIVHAVTLALEDNDKMIVAITTVCFSSAFSATSFWFHFFQAKIALLYNLSLYAPRDDSDDAVQCLSFILHQLEKEKDPENGVYGCYRLANS